MNVVHIETCLICFINQVSPTANPREYISPIPRARLQRSLGKPERSTVIQLKAVLAIEDRAHFTTLLAIVPAYSISRVLRQSLVNLSHLEIQSLLQAYNIRAVGYQRINDDLLAPVPAIPTIPPRRTNPNIKRHCLDHTGLTRRELNISGHNCLLCPAAGRNQCHLRQTTYHACLQSVHAMRSHSRAVNNPPRASTEKPGSPRHCPRNRQSDRLTSPAKTTDLTALKKGR